MQIFCEHQMIIWPSHLRLPRKPNSILELQRAKLKKLLKKVSSNKQTQVQNQRKIHFSNLAQRRNVLSPSFNRFGKSQPVPTN